MYALVIPQEGQGILNKRLNMQGMSKILKTTSATARIPKVISLSLGLFIFSRDFSNASHLAVLTIYYTHFFTFAQYRRFSPPCAF